MTKDHLPLTDFIMFPQDAMLERAQQNVAELRRRHSIRKFSDRAVPKEIVQCCIQAAGLAPSGANHQPWHFVAISDAKIKAEIRLQALHHAGLGTLTHTPKPMTFLTKICQRDSDNERPYMLIVTGFPAEDATIPLHATRKKSLEQICTFVE